MNKYSVAPFRRLSTLFFPAAVWLVSIFHSSIASAVPETIEQRWATRTNGSGDSDDSHYAIASDADGNVISCGALNNAGTVRDFYVAKYDKATGAVLWSFTKQGSRADGTVNVTDTALIVAVAPGGDIYAAGNVTGGALPGSFSDWYLVKLDPMDGHVIWERAYKGTGDGTDTIAHMAVDANGDVVLCGYLQESSGTATVKMVDSNGTTVWTQKIINRIGVAGDVNVALQRVAFDNTNNPIIIGKATFWTGSYELYATKIDRDSGVRSWEWHEGTMMSNTDAGGVAVDADNNVVVSGVNFGGYPHLGGTGSDLIVAKINGASGAEIWRSIYDGGVGGSEIARNVALSPSGDVFVVGSSERSQGTYDIITRKVNGQTGAASWTQRYAGAGSSFGWAIVATPGGDVVSLGVAQPIGGSSQDARLAKYAGADGALIWETFYNGSIGGTELVQSSDSLAQGSLGTLAISPSSSSANGYDWATVLYEPVTDVDGDGIIDSLDPDDDNDGMTDVFEQQYFGHPTAGDPADDADSDGQANLSEFQAGTNPNDSNSVLRISAIRRQGNDMLIDFEAAPDKSYRVVFGTNFTDGFPTTLATVTATPTGGARTVTDSGALLQSSARFYRVILQP